MLKELSRVKNAGKAAWQALTWIDGASSYEQLWTRGPARLLRYQGRPEVAKAPVLLVMPFINRFRLADLEPGSSLIAALTEAGHSVYLMDWGSPRRIDQRLDFEDYVIGTLGRAAKSVGADEQSIHGGFHLMGICLGGTLSVMFAALNSDKLLSLTTLVTPVDFSPMAEMRLWVDAAHFPVEGLTEAFGNMPGSLIGSGFDNLAPASSALKYPRAWQRMADFAFAEQFFTLESWNRDSVDVPGAIYRRLIRDLYRDNKLIKGQFTLRGRKLDLRNITCPTMVLAAKGDSICRPQAARALIDAVGASQKVAHDLPGGHVASIVGPRAQKTCYPLLREWLDQ